MASLSGIAKVQCEKCGNVLSIDAGDLDLEQIGAEERQMGLEIFYAAEAVLQCPKCRQAIEVGYDASEYPVGMANFSETYCQGARLIQGYADIDVAFDEEIYDFNEGSGLYLPPEKQIITNLRSGVSDLIVEANRKPEILYDIDPRKFEELVAYIFSSHGFMVELTKRTRDGGRDIIAIKSDLGIQSKFLIECKRYAIDRPVSVDLVRNLYGVQMQEGANKSVLATTSRFTNDARIFANTKNTTEWCMDLKDFEDIRQWIGATVDKRLGRLGPSGRP